jgi:predicted regulator of Ras-like GTPase activity (Roadblock/LC7/MglB family)
MRAVNLTKPMFKEAIRDVVEGTDGATAGILMDFEGIPVESYAKEGAVDLNVVGAEYSVILKSIQRATESLEAGGAREVAIQSEKGTTIIRILNEEYFLALALLPEANFGKGRYLLRIAAPKLLEQLI